MNLEGKTVTVVGLAKSGIAAARLLRARGATVRATDAKKASELSEEARSLERDGVRLFLGGHPDDAIAGSDLVVTSPGVPEDARPLLVARARSIEVIGELELAWRLLPKGAEVIAITGSNGKSTTTSLTGHFLADQGVWVGGNLGTPFSQYHLTKFESAPRWIVLEVSSFMLETAPSFAPRAAAILNVSPNHLDRHASMAEYAALKARIWKNAGPGSWTIFNRDDATVSELAGKARGRKLSFGVGAAPDAGGAGYAWSPREARVSLRLPGEPVEEYDLAKFPAPGAHNAANAAAALLLARIAGARPAALREGLASFAPLEHRLERCGAKDGVVFYNDSKATTSEALSKSLGVFEKDVVLLAGGKDKGGDFAALRDAVRKKVRLLVTFGTAKDLIADALAGTTAIVRVEDLPRAFAEATKGLRGGETVLFSPACASYDQFTNFEERGRRFKALVAAWMKEAKA